MTNAKKAEKEQRDLCRWFVRGVKNRLWKKRKLQKEWKRKEIRETPIYTLFCVVVFYILRLYKSLWRFAGFSEFNRIFASSIITMIFHCIGITIFFRRMPISYYMMGAVMQFGLINIVRFSYRYITMQKARRAKEQLALHNAMIIGAGAAGQVIIRELKNSAESTAKPVCVIDDNVNKWGRLMEGVPVSSGGGFINGGG